jgi:plasmid maintenance system antidote protein VapI
MSGIGEIHLDPFRDRFEASGLTVTEVARRMERDPELVRRMIKRRPYYKQLRRGDRVAYFQDRMTYDMAVRLARAMNVDPYEMGL